MQQDNTIALSTPCDHRCDKLANVSIRKCEYKYSIKSNTWYHVIHFKDPVPLKDFQTLKTIVSVDYMYNIHNEVTQLWETLSTKPLCCMYNIGSDINNDIFDELVMQLITLVCKFTSNEIISQVLTSKPSLAARTFLQYCIHIAEDGPSFKIIQLNRFALKHINLYPIKFKSLQLKKQFLFIPELIKSLYFYKKTNKRITNSSSSTPSTNSTRSLGCSSNCKLLGYSQKYLYVDYQKLHHYFCVLCNPSVENKIQNIISLSDIFLGIDECLAEAVRKIQELL